MLTLTGYVLRNLGRQKVRTALSILGVMLGVWLVVVFAALSAGVLDTARSMLTEFGEDFHLYKRDVADQFLSRVPEAPTREALRKVPGVEATASVVWWFLKIENTTFTPVYGLRPGEFALDRFHAEGLRPFSAPDAAEVLVGEALLDAIGREVGGEIEAEGRTYRIVGVYATGQPWFDNAVVMPYDRFREDLWAGAADASFIAVKTAHGADPSEVAKLVEEQIPDVATVGTIDELAKVDQGIERMRIVSVVIMVVATILGLLFVLMGMLTSVIERVREVGILRAIGWRKRQIVAIVEMEGLLFAVAGFLLGVPTGMLGVKIIGRITEIETFLRPSYEPALFVRAFVVAMLAALIGGVYPAWRAASLSPAEAIRHE